MGGQQAKVEWRDGGIPVSTRFNDPYFSLENGLAESRHVFLGGNDLPARFCDGFHIAELGFGTGLNLLTALAAFKQTGIAGKFRFTSFEAFPLARTDAQTALKAFPELAALAAPMLAKWDNNGFTFQTDHIVAQIIAGDAREMLPIWDGVADAWFLDGFSPAKNPELWGIELLAQVGKHTAPSGTFATFSAAGHVRRAMCDAGFQVSRRAGFARKRHMSVGVLQ